ncbi:hypothetical protein O9H85_31075 [Paenibacillus filicis]|uniref:MobA-like NTP transferase domain-containing protein n=1 Tax=Paenibacillus gyeongsangnamensis TaxID=3388067 RepID=A0ABT4QIM5_9BACL|nr:hypothetical protein [Paenibacillus filicis]MCZ8516732.1 hypothetical protein [Paenibacillus filicis]
MQNRGPLDGMYAGLSLARNRDVWIVGSHMPFISAKAAELREKKIEGGDAVLHSVQAGVYPLHGVYDRSCANNIWRLLESGEHPLMRLLKVIDWLVLEETVFLNEGIGPEFVSCFGTPEEYEQLLKQLSSLTRIL